MKSKLKYGILITIGLLILLVVDLPISNRKIAGLYTNNNYNDEPFYAEIPYIKDTLILNENGTYSSNFYNNGSYEIKSGLFSNQLSISYEINSDIPKSILEHSKSKNETETISDKAIHTFKVKNIFLQSIRIQLVEDLNYHYSKRSE